MTNERRGAQSAMRLAEKWIILTCCIAFGALKANAVPYISKTAAVTYLSHFGYLPAIHRGSKGPISEEAFSRAISKFQSFMGIRITGEIDDETTNLMIKPRCGVPDIVGPEWGKRSKRYAFPGNKWYHRHVTYKVTKYSSKLDAATVDEEIARAFAVWSNYVDLTFTPKSGQVDIEISFERGWHGDEQPFEESSNVLAHTRLPGPGSGGDVHFNDDQPWIGDSHYGLDFFKVAVHEFGHALGLDHSTIHSAIMYPTYKSYYPNLMLDSDDIVGIQALYGAKRYVPHLCDVTKIDTIFIAPDNDVYVFKGKYYWRLMNGGIAAGYPKLIAERWSGLPSNIDAAFAHNGFTFFFKGSKCWAYSGVQPIIGFPRDIRRNIPGVPNDIDAVVGPYATGNLYYFKGNRFWKYNIVKNMYWSWSTDPVPISDWPGFLSKLGYFLNKKLSILWNKVGLPNNLDAALTYNGYTYFFKDDVYYRYDESTLLLDAAGPRKTASDWFGC